MKGPTERAIVQKILRFLNEIPSCVARKRWGGGRGVAGDPDITGCIHGRHLEFEVKRPGQRPTPLQAMRLEEWYQAGAVVAVVTSREDVESILASEGLLESLTLAKILVEREQSQFISTASSEDIFIARTGAILGNRGHIKTLLPQRLNSGTWNALVREKPH